MIHNFDTEIAEKYGMLEAILLNNIYFWIEKNRANDSNFYDGTYWTYNSTRAFNELFPYVSERQIKNALKHLREEGILLTGNYNKSTYDRTLWYALSKKGLSIVQKCPMEGTNMPFGWGDNVPPIPDNKPDNKPDDKPDDISGPELQSEPETKPVQTPNDNTSLSQTEYESPVVITMQLNTGVEYPFTQRDVEVFTALYPAVDVMQQMRAMKGWCMNNPGKRKTQRGIRRFVNSWLSKEQDRGGAGSMRNSPQKEVRHMTTEEYADFIRGWSK